MVSRTTAGCIVLAASLCMSATAADDISDLGTTIAELTPDFYWPMENSFSSATPSGSNVLIFYAYEEGTPDRPTTLGASAYFPLLPYHMTNVPSSTAIIFGESANDLAGAERFLELTDDAVHFDGDEPQDALGLSKKDEWSLHVMVSPDADSQTGNYETIFTVGDSSNGITLDVDRKTSEAVFRLTRVAADTTYTSTVTVGDAYDYEESYRSWYQVTVRYYDHGPSSPHRQVLRVNAIEDWDNSNGWIAENTSGEAVVGADQSGTTVFTGAMHHFVIWSSDIGTSGVSDLETARTVAPTARADLEIEWNDDPTYYIWTVPILNDDLEDDRDLTNWGDPLWDRTGVWPMVRFRCDTPTSANTQSTPPSWAGYSVQGGNLPEHVAQQTMNWIEYIDENLTTYCAKDLDGGYLLLMQNWGKANESTPYIDRNAARAIMRNWRDSPYEWREGSDALHKLGLPDPNEIAEIHTPFYREGMSLNAFRTRDIFARLSVLLTTETLPTPTRLHFDTEARNVIKHALPSEETDSSDEALNSVGWWYAATEDSRADDESFWLSDTDELADATAPASPSSGPYVSANDEWGIDFTNSAIRQYDFALGHALLTPAIQELDADIRASEYNVYFSNDADPQNYAYPTKASRPIEDTSVVSLDFASPVLYPLKTNKLEGTEEAALNNWAHEDILDFATLDITLIYDEESPDIDDLTEDLDNIFVELAKHNVAASYLANGAEDGKPMAPWFAMPGEQWDISGRFDMETAPGYDDLDYTARWQEVARTAVFAYRRGVREFIFWGGDDVASTQVNVENLALVLDAIEYAATNQTDVTTTGASSRSDPGFGVPDGNVNESDLNYFYDRWLTDFDQEGDFTGGANDHPDGVVDSDDWIDFQFQYTIEED